MSHIDRNYTNTLDPTPQDSSAHDSWRGSYNSFPDQDLEAEETILLNPKSKPTFAWLVIVKGDNLGQLFTLKKEGTIIGRSRRCNISLSKDGAVSTEHAKVYQEGSDFVIRDLASANGTWVNGKKVYHQGLKENDLITVGQTLLVFKQIAEEHLNG